MKQIKVILLACALIGTAIAALSWTENATISLRSKTYSGASNAGVIGNLSAANSGKDTLVGAGAVHRDSCAVWVWQPANGGLYDFYVAQLTGSITACSITLQGLDDTTGIDWHDPSVWHNIVPVNTYCADFLNAANTTTVPGASKHYFYWVPPNTNPWRITRIFADFTGTFTATYRGKLTYPN